MPAEGRIGVCTLTELAPGEVRVVPLGGGPGGEFQQGLVLLDASGTPRAYLNRCEHLPIPLDAGTGDFLSEDGAHILCSTHGALYRLADGLCVAGPCVGESLTPLPLRVDGGVVYLEAEAACRAR